MRDRLDEFILGIWEVLGMWSIIEYVVFYFEILENVECFFSISVVGFIIRELKRRVVEIESFCGYVCL